MARSPGKRAWQPAAWGGCLTGSAAAAPGRREGPVGAVNLRTPFAFPALAVALIGALNSSRTIPPMMGLADSTVIVLLGTGMPRPTPDASGPATAIVVGSRTFLFDAGPGVERRLSAVHLPIKGVTAVFITHLHSDHTLGLPDLIFTSW